MLNDLMFHQEYSKNQTVKDVISVKQLIDKDLKSME